MAPLGCPAHFASGRFGRHVKREVLAEHLKTLSQRLGKVPEFANYATDGPNMRTTL